MGIDKFAQLAGVPVSSQVQAAADALDAVEKHKRVYWSVFRDALLPHAGTCRTLVQAMFASCGRGPVGDQRPGSPMSP